MIFRLKIVAIAEPEKHRLERFKREHQIPDDLAVEDWKALAEMPKLADAAIIATQDQV